MASLKSEDIKKKLIKKLNVITDELVIDPNNEKPKQLEAKMNIINSYVSLLDSYEKQIRDTLKSKQKQQDSENANNSGALIAQILRKVSDDIGTVENAEASLDDSILEKKIQDNKLEITDGELDKDAEIASLEDVLK
jgi:hypothetical protein